MTWKGSPLIHEAQFTRHEEYFLASCESRCIISVVPWRFFRELSKVWKYNPDDVIRWVPRLYESVILKSLELPYFNDIFFIRPSILWFSGELQTKLPKVYFLVSRVLHSAVGDRAYLLQKNKSMIRSGESWRCVASKETKANEQMCAGSVRTNNVHRKWQNLVNILFFSSSCSACLSFSLPSSHLITFVWRACCENVGLESHVRRNAVRKQCLFTPSGWWSGWESFFLNYHQFIREVNCDLASSVAPLYFRSRQCYLQRNYIFTPVSLTAMEMLRTIGDNL